MSIEVRNISQELRQLHRAATTSASTSTPGELVALLGPSGSGKTTLLRIIAGLETPDAGSVLFDGEDATDTHVRERQVGFVFQHYALFRHMTVFENVAFGLRVQAARPSARRRRDREQGARAAEAGAARLAGRPLSRRSSPAASGSASRWPARWRSSQGAAARRAVRRARRQGAQGAAPLAAPAARRAAHHQLFVTHDQEEALEVADRVVVMNAGKIEQVGTPEEVYDQPATPFVYEFLGNVNLFHGRAHEGEVHLEGLQHRFARARRRAGRQGLRLCAPARPGCPPLRAGRRGIVVQLRAPSRRPDRPAGTRSRPRKPNPPTMPTRTPSSRRRSPRSNSRIWGSRRARRWW